MLISVNMILLLIIEILRGFELLRKKWGCMCSYPSLVLCNDYEIMRIHKYVTSVLLKIIIISCKFDMLCVIQFTGSVKACAKLLSILVYFMLVFMFGYNSTRGK